MSGYQGHSGETGPGGFGSMVAEEESEQEEGGIMNHHCRRIFGILYDTAKSIDSANSNWLVSEARWLNENLGEKVHPTYPLWAIRAYREPEDSAEVWEAKQFIASRAKTLTDEVRSRVGISLPKSELFNYAWRATSDLSLELKERAFEGFIKCACPR